LLFPKQANDEQKRGASDASSYNLPDHARARADSHNTQQKVTETAAENANDGVPQHAKTFSLEEHASEIATDRANGEINK
jgi:hypothetical protein